VVDLPGVMGDTVLVRTQRLTPRWNICRGDDMEEVLVSNERFVSELERVIQRLGYVWEVRAKGKLRDNVR
jgi:hypothetical protein